MEVDKCDALCEANNESNEQTQSSVFDYPWDFDFSYRVPNKEKTNDCFWLTKNPPLHTKIPRQ